MPLHDVANMTRKGDRKRIVAKATIVAPCHPPNPTGKRLAQAIDKTSKMESCMPVEPGSALADLRFTGSVMHRARKPFFSLPGYCRLKRRFPPGGVDIGFRAFFMPTDNELSSEGKMLKAWNWPLFCVQDIEQVRGHQAVGQKMQGGLSAHPTFDWPGVHHSSAGSVSFSTGWPPSRCSSMMVETSSLATLPYITPSG